MADPLSLLRAYNISRKEIIEENDQIIFDDVAWSKNVHTNFVMYGTGKDDSPKEYYTLECLLYLLKNVHLAHPVYVRQAGSLNIPVVHRPDRRDLLAFLNGEISTCASIDRSAPLEIPKQIKRPTQEELNANAMKKSRMEDTLEVQRVKQQLAARLDAPKEAAVNIDNIKSLSETMSVEKIAAIKAKRLANKRTTIKGHDDIQVAPELKEILNFDINVTKEIIKRERVWRNRTTILQSSGKTFSKSVFATLNAIKQREHDKNSGYVGRTPSVLPGKPVTGTSNYNRYDQERFVNVKEGITTGGFHIDTMGSYHGMTLKSVAEANEQKLHKIDQQRSSTAMKLVSKYDSKPVYSYADPQTRVGAVLATQTQKRISRTPIIVIPAATSSLITMLNARDILQDLKFVTMEEKKKSGAKRDNEILLQRRKDATSTMPYRVIDNPDKLTQSEWDRVVAVFVMGPSWQFKGWPWKGNPVDIFTNVCAFHLKYDEMKLDANVAKWAVYVIELSRTKRHLDRAALMSFWERLDKHIVQRKPHLKY